MNSHPSEGGGGAICYELCRQLVEMDHRVDVVTMRYNHLPKYEIRDGIAIYRTPAWRQRPDICRTHEMGSFLAGALNPTLKLAADNHYDVIHCHFLIPTGPLALLVSRWKRIPFIITCHGSDIPGYNPDRFGFVHRMIHPIWKGLARRCPLLVSPSHSLRNLALGHIPSLDIRVIPNGFQVQQYPSCQKQNRILMCSRILPRKGFQYALQAIARIQTDWEVHIIGDGTYLEELKTLAGQLGVPVQFYGWLDKQDPRFMELYATSSIFIFPSEAENFPTVLLEAMSAGMAIITSTAGGCPEVVGDAAILVPPRDSDALEEKLKLLLENRAVRDELAQKARERIRQFNWDVIASQYVTLFQEAMAKNEKTR